VQKWHNELGDIKTGTAAHASELVDSRDAPPARAATREDGTRLFEMLLDIDAYEARSTLDEIDSRFRASRATRRPRLPRRKGKAGAGGVT